MDDQRVKAAVKPKRVLYLPPEELEALGYRPTEEYAQAFEAHARTCKCLSRAEGKLFEGLEAWRREKTPHTEDRLQHYYLVHQDCSRNLAAAEAAVEAAMRDIPGLHEDEDEA